MQTKLTFGNLWYFHEDLKQKWPLLYSWRFSRYSETFHWLVHGHMTSNNETVSRQMPWAGNIAKTMTSNGKQFTVTREMLTAVARDRWKIAGIPARFSNFAFVLFCYITNHLMTGPLGNSEFCFPRDQSLSVYCCPEIRILPVRLESLGNWSSFRGLLKNSIFKNNDTYSNLIPDFSKCFSSLFDGLN